MAKKSRDFEYYGDERTTEEVVHNSKRSGGAYDSYLSTDIQMLKIKEGESTLRILPPSWPKKDIPKWGRGWHIEVVLHYGVGPDNATYLCIDKMLGDKCPICEARRDATDDERDQLRPQSRFLCWAVDRDNERAGPQVWSMPITLFKEVNAKSIDKKNDTPIPIDHPDKGYDIYLSKEGTKLKTKYRVDEVARDPTPLADDERLQDRWLDYISEHTLPDVLQYYDTEHIDGVLMGKTTREDDDAGDKGDRRRGKSDRRKSASRGDSRDYMDDDGDDEDEPRERTRGRGRDEAEDDDRKPPRSRTRSVKDEEELDDDIPFDDESEEDEPPPRRTARSRRDDDEEEEEPRAARKEDKPRERRRVSEPEDDDPPEEEDENAKAVSRAKGKVTEMSRRRAARR